MKLVYIAGPFRGPHTWAIEQNIRRAEALALEVWKMGAACICPHANTRFFQHVLPDHVWLEGDLEMVRRCDAILLTPDWLNSEGARGEEHEAMRCGKLVFGSLAKLERWVKYENQKEETCPPK